MNTLIATKEWGILVSPRHGCDIDSVYRKYVFETNGFQCPIICFGSKVSMENLTLNGFSNDFMME